MVPAGGWGVSIHAALVPTTPFEAVYLRCGAGPFRRSRHNTSPVPKHVSGVFMLTRDHVAGSEANENANLDEIMSSASGEGGTSQSTDTPGHKMNPKAPASPRRALEEARRVVRRRQQQARDHQAMAAAKAAAVVAGTNGAVTTSGYTHADLGTGGDHRERAIMTTPGSGALRPLINEEIAVVGSSRPNNALGSGTRSITGGNHTVEGSTLRTYDVGRGVGGARSQGQRGGGRGYKSMGHGRVFPDFTSIDTSASYDENGTTTSKKEGLEHDASAQALVTAMRATLASTMAQVEERKSRATNAVMTENLQDDYAPQGWLRAVGLIRRACAEVLPESSAGDRQNGSSPSRAGRSADLKPLPRIAFELALQVCALCARPDAGLEVLRLMRSAGLKPNLEAYKAVMDGYSIERRQGRALFTFQTMMAIRDAGIVPDLEVLSVATEACSRARDREGALHFMDQAFKLGLNPDERMYREAIVALSQSGRWLEARDLALHWRAAAAAAAATDPSNGPAVAGSGHPSLPPAVCNTAILKAMGKAGRVDEALSWLSGIVSLAKKPNIGEGEGIGDARPGARSVEILSVLDHASFLAVLSACSRAGRWESAVEMLRTMKGAGIVPEATAFNTALAAFEHRPRASPSASSSERGSDRSQGSQRWRAALELLSEMEEQRGLEPDVVAYNRVINILRWAGQGERAVGLLESMKRRSEGRDGGVRPDIITYNSAIAACAAGKGSNWEKAVQLLNELQRKGLKPDRYSYTSAIHACAKAGNPVEALRLLRTMEANEVVPDVIAMTACIDALASGGQWSEAVGLLDEMRTKGIAPNERTYQAAIQACGKGGQWQRALELLALLEARPSGATVQEYNCAMMACVTGGEPTRALDILERVKRSTGGVNEGPDMLTYTSAITACAAEGMWKTALGLLEEMRRAGPRTRPNVRSYTAAIAACGRAGEWRQALELHHKISEEGLAPDGASFNAVISAARRGGQHDLSMELLASMLRAGLSPDHITVAELLSSLSDRGKWDKAIQVLEIAARTGAIPSPALDGNFEVDVSHLPSAIAKVKVRATLQRVLGLWRKNSNSTALQDLVFVTGTGSAARTDPARLGQRPRFDNDDCTARGKTSELGESRNSAGAEDEGEGWRAQRYSDRSFSLGKLLAEDLRMAYRPALQARAPPTMAGCLVVTAENLAAWASAQDGEG